MLNTQLWDNYSLNSLSNPYDKFLQHKLCHQNNQQLKNMKQALFLFLFPIFEVFFELRNFGQSQGRLELQGE